MNIRPGEAELFDAVRHADRQTERDVTYLIVAFRSFAEVPINCFSFDVIRPDTKCTFGF